MGSGALFGVDLPPGFLHRENFLTTAEEAELVAHIDRVEFSSFEMRGVVARRRVAFFGQSYDLAPSTADDRKAPGRSSLEAGDTPSPPIPEFLHAVRERLAKWAGVKPEDFAMALINQYPPGAPIGWHRDAPQYDITAGISLVSQCVMRLRPYISPSKAAAEKIRRKTTHEIELLPRSAYVISGEARSGYEHSIPEVANLRYSITFRTLR